MNSKYTREFQNIRDELIRRGFAVEFFKEEHRFHKSRKWRFDLALIVNHKKIAVEVEGGIWVGGRHTRPVGFAKDMKKYNEATICGWAVLRYMPKEVKKTTKVVDDIERLIYDIE